MDNCRKKHSKSQNCCCFEEVSSIEWEAIDMTEQEEDIICRMHKLVGDKWALIAGRLPGRKAEEIERFWLMRNNNNNNNNNSSDTLLIMATKRKERRGS